METRIGALGLDTAQEPSHNNVTIFPAIHPIVQEEWRACQHTECNRVIACIVSSTLQETLKLPYSVYAAKHSLPVFTDTANRMMIASALYAANQCLSGSPDAETATPFTYCTATLQSHQNQEGWPISVYLHIYRSHGDHDAGSESASI